MSFPVGPGFTFGHKSTLAMRANKIEIINYNTSYYSDLVKLLLELHFTYFNETASDQIREIRQDKNIKKSYENCVNTIGNNEDGSWQIFLAKTNSNKVIGFIIGSISVDEELGLSKVGTIEDWFVETEFRQQGIATKLFNELENGSLRKIVNRSSLRRGSETR